MNVIIPFFTCSNFSEIFDVDWFISRISKDVKIIRDLPRIGDKIITPYTTRVPRKCNAKCYQTRILPILKKKHVSSLQINGTCLPFPVHQNMISSIWSFVYITWFVVLSILLFLLHCTLCGNLCWNLLFSHPYCPNAQPSHSISKFESSRYRMVDTDLLIHTTQTPPCFQEKSVSRAYLLDNICVVEYTTCWVGWWGESTS